MGKRTAAIGNTQLVEYGIYNEGSDIRAHVCVDAGRVYVFPTANAVKLVGIQDYPLVPTKTRVNGVHTITAKGYLVPPGDIEGCESIKIPKAWMKKVAFSKDDSPTEKGEKAVKIVKGLIKRGMFPFHPDGKEVSDFNLQVEGLDVIVTMSARIQVKCDYQGGPRWHGGTGNLYLQTAECNPLRQH